MKASECAVPTVRTHKWFDEYIDSGGNIELVVADTLSHFKPRDYVPYLQEAAVWLQDEVWEKLFQSLLCPFTNLVDHEKAK